VYPGAKAHKDEKDDSPSVQMGLWGSSFGFKLAVMKMESNDAPEKIAEFYKKALAKYGTVLNCSDASQKTSSKNKTGASNQIDCEDDKPEKGGLVFKAGTKEKQHIVGIQPNGQGSVFQLVYVEARGDDKRLLRRVEKVQKGRGLEGNLLCGEAASQRGAAWAGPGRKGKDVVRTGL
jgi:hypothetical protein